LQRIIESRNSEGNEKNKCVQLTATTVAAPVQFAFAQCVKKISNVHWLDLGSSDAIWVLEVEKLGPLIVNIDTDGNNFYEEKKKEIDKNVKKAYEMLRISNSETTAGMKSQPSLES
jgi:tartrate dehydratase beta subunit/fumarate hydratase class I family protein